MPGYWTVHHVFLENYIKRPWDLTEALDKWHQFQYAPHTDSNKDLQFSSNWFLIRTKPSQFCSCELWLHFHLDLHQDIWISFYSPVSFSCIHRYLVIETTIDTTEIQQRYNWGMLDVVSYIWFIVESGDSLWSWQSIPLNWLFNWDLWINSRLSFLFFCGIREESLSSGSYGAFQKTFWRALKIIWIHLRLAILVPSIYYSEYEFICGGC